MLAGEQHIGAGRALRVGKRAVLLHDELPAQRNHEEHARASPPMQREQEDARVFEIEAEKDQRRQGEDDAGRDGLAGVAGGLHDVVFEDRGAAQSAQHADREHRDRNRCRDGQPGAQADVDRDRAEENAEDRAQQQRAEGKLGARFGGWDEWLELLRGWLDLLRGLGHGGSTSR